MPEFKSFFAIYDKNNNVYLTFKSDGTDISQRKIFSKKSTALAIFKQYCRACKKQGLKIDLADYELAELKLQEIGRYSII